MTKLDLAKKFIFNAKEKFFHLPSEIDKHLIKETGLFNNMDAALYQKMLKSIQLEKFLPNEIIFREGENAEFLYIITEGSVRVFTYDTNKNKIPLARLNKGDYFGFQALLGQAHKSRNANIECIDATTVIKIPDKFFLESLEKDFATREHVKKVGYKHALETLSAINEFYNQIKHHLENIPNPQILDVSQGDTIFNVGDKADKVYILLDGQVKLLIPDSSNKYNAITLNKGHIFGELGVLRTKPRSGTAVAQTNAHLLAIDGEEFKKMIPENPELQQALTTLLHSYQIPLKGAMTQFVGYVDHMGPTSTTVYKLEDGDTISATTFLTQELFSIFNSNFAQGDLHFYAKVKNEIRLFINDHLITGITTSGSWEQLPTLCRILLEKQTVTDEQLKQFEKTGEIKLPTLLPDGAQVICDCLMVTKQQLQDQIDHGANTLELLSLSTGACTACRACSYRIKQMLGKSVWLSAVMKRITDHTNYISSFSLKPWEQRIKPFKPGQHVIVQVKIGDLWVERPYTISGKKEDGSIYITIKRESQGYFTNWLYESAGEELEVNITEPQGDFCLDTSHPGEVLCFAGGIGITPFITFANNLPENKRMHLLYAALTQKDFVFIREFGSIASVNPAFTIQYKAAETDGLLTESEILQVVQSLKEPDIYICGPRGFIDLIKNTLENNGYSSEKVHIEEFVHAGSK